MQSELFLIRHGETIWNKESRFQGQQDSQLTPLGIAQAVAAAAYLREHGLSALYSSDLPRTLQTAHPIAISTGLPILPEPALRERNLGIFEGLTRAEVEERYSPEFKRYQSREPGFVIPSGESLEQLYQRGAEIMDRLARRHLDERIVVVSHGALLTAFLRHLSGIEMQDPIRFTVPNGSISHVRFESDGSTWTILSQCESLEPIFAPTELP